MLGTRAESNELVVGHRCWLGNQDGLGLEGSRPDRLGVIFRVDLYQDLYFYILISGR
jgi:hypothetical protein